MRYADGFGEPGRVGTQTGMRGIDSRPGALSQFLHDIYFALLIFAVCKSSFVVVSTSATHPAMIPLAAAELSPPDRTE